MGLATLGFSDGPKITFRIDPNAIDWKWSVQTAVTETVGGRVIQVVGAYLDDLVVQGSFGQDHSAGSQGESWRQAEAFFKTISAIMEFQSKDSTKPGLMHRPAIFTYSPKNWRFSVYVKDFSDPDGGGSITHSVGKFAHNYSLTLFIVEELSDALVVAGTSHGVLSKKRAQAIEEYVSRISDGIGWHFSEYNGHVTGGAATPKSGGVPNGEDISPTK
jgi:hypothetical protein